VDAADAGSVAFRFTSEVQGGHEVILAADNEVQAVLNEFTDVSVSNAMRAALLTVITSNYFFTAAQAQLLLGTFDVGFEQTQAAVNLFMRTVDTDALVAAIDTMSEAARFNIQHALAERSLFRYMNPTGHYRLDLSKPADRLLTGTLKVRPFALFLELIASSGQCTRPAMLLGVSVQPPC